MHVSVQRIAARLRRRGRRFVHRVDKYQRRVPPVLERYVQAVVDQIAAADDRFHSSVGIQNLISHPRLQLRKRYILTDRADRVPSIKQDSRFEATATVVCYADCRRGVTRKAQIVKTVELKVTQPSVISDFVYDDPLLMLADLR